MGATLMIPSRTIEQRMDALQKGNAVRSYRAQLKKDVKAGRKTVARLLVAGDPMLDTMKVFDLLVAAPRYGRIKANGLLRKHAVSPSKTIGGLSDRQRTLLVTALGGTMVEINDALDR